MTTNESRIGKSVGTCPHCKGITRYTDSHSIICESCSTVLYEPGYMSYTTIIVRGFPITTPDYQARIPERGHGITLSDRVGLKVIMWEWS